jgi:hypothetical protein
MPLWIRAIVILSIALTGTAAEPPAVPCKSAVQLKEALRYVVSTKDTNFLWRLHFWNGVEPKHEKTQKWSTLSILGLSADRDMTITSWEIAPAAPNDNISVRRRDGTVTMLTLPVAGNITISGTEKIAMFDGRTKKMGFRNAPIPFGRDTNGNYWLTVTYAVSTNAAAGVRKK